MATAEQTVSAVLEATNKAYIVETGDSEDGLSHYRRWSDGTIEQWGTVKTGSSEPTTVTFPTAFTNTNYSFVFMIDNYYYVPGGPWEGTRADNKTETSIDIAMYSTGNAGYDRPTGYAWQAIGK